MENRILEEQEKKFRQLTAILANLPRPDNKSGFFAVRCDIPEALQSSCCFSTFSIAYRRYFTCAIQDLSHRA
jgi:hypothetical protein